jgi:hypothetical protein
VVSGPPERLQAVHAAAAARPSHAPLELLEDVPRGVPLDLGRVAPERVSEVVERAFGRARTLSGQLPGRVEAVRCAARAFSAFTEALLAELAVDPDAASPVPLIDRRALAALQEVSGRGLDEGATLIHGGVTRGGPGSLAATRRACRRSCSPTSRRGCSSIPAPRRGRCCGSCGAVERAHSRSLESRGRVDKMGGRSARSGVLP